MLLLTDGGPLACLTERRHRHLAFAISEWRIPFDKRIWRAFVTSTCVRCGIEGELMVEMSEEAHEQIVSREFAEEHAIEQAKRDLAGPIPDS